MASLVGGGLIAGAAVSFWLRRRRNHQLSNPAASQEQGHQQPPMLASTHHGFFGYAEKDGLDRPPEMGGRTFTELEARRGDNQVKALHVLGEVR